MSGLTLEGVAANVNFLGAKVNKIVEFLTKQNPAIALEFKQHDRCVDELLHANPERMLMLIPEIVEIRAGDSIPVISSSRFDFISKQEPSWFRPLQELFYKGSTTQMFADSFFRLVRPEVTERPLGVNSQGKLIISNPNPGTRKWLGHMVTSAKKLIAELRSEDGPGEIRALIERYLKENSDHDAFLYALIHEATKEKVSSSNSVRSKVCTALENILLR